MPGNYDMTESAYSQSLKDVHTSTTVLCVEQIPHTTTELQKFLSRHGCSVLTKQTVDVSYLYVIVCGTPDFVKSFLDSHTVRYQRLFLLLQNADKKDINYFLRYPSSKIAAVGSQQISSRETITLFAYFFTNDTRIKYFTNTHDRPLQKPSAANIHNSSNTETHIQKLITEIYSKQDKHAKKKRDLSSRSKKFYVYFILFLVFLLSLLPVWHITSTLGAVVSLSYTASPDKIASQKQTSKARVLSKFFLNQSDASLRLLSPFLLHIGVSEELRQQQRVITTLAALIAAQDAVLRVSEDMKSALEPIDFLSTGRSQGLPPSRFDSLRRELFYIQNLLGVAQAELQYIYDHPAWFMSQAFFRDQVNSQKSTIAHIRSYVTTIDSIASLYPFAGGFSGKKTYLLLLQNSMELRPTGGFIGSVGIAHIEEGILTDIRVQDIYELDGQLRGHVDPPKPIAELLKQEHWYLRDSNWDPNFPSSARQAIWFYEKETGQSIDGVIAVSSPILVDFLRSAGPLTLPLYNDTITADNFFPKSLYYVQEGFFPGSTQKANFLSSLLLALIQRVQSGGISPLAIVQTFQEGVRQKNILLFFQDENAQALTQKAGWSGEIPSRPPCHATYSADTCISNYIYVVDSNLSVNKVNYYVQRKIIHQVEVSGSGDIEATLQVEYSNTSTPTSGGGGVYTTYTRIYLPQNTNVSSIQIDGKELPIRTPGEEAPLPYAELIDSNTEELGVVGVGFSVLPEKDMTLILRYKQSGVVSADKTTVLEMQTQKQPGQTQTNTLVTLSFPPGQEVYVDSPNSIGINQKDGPVVAKSGMVEYNTDLSEDTFLHVYFLKTP